MSVPARRHEELLELLRQDPRIALEWLERSGLVDVPAFKSIDVRPGEIRELLPTERRADLVILLSNEKPVLVFVVELQRRCRADKRRTWPIYLTHVAGSYRCPAVLIVVALSPRVVRWAKRPIPLGHPGFELRPIVIAPGDIPRITEAGEARRAPYRAILSALVHAKDPGAEHEVLAALHGADTLDPSDADAWREMLLFAVKSNAVARKALEAMMDLQHFRKVSVWFKEGREEGRAEGREEGREEAARRLLTRLLAKRGFVLGPEQQARVAACGDVDALERWCEQIVDAQTAEDALRLGSNEEQRPRPGGRGGAGATRSRASGVLPSPRPHREPPGPRLCLGGGPRFVANARRVDVVARRRPQPFEQTKRASRPLVERLAHRGWHNSGRVDRARSA